MASPYLGEVKMTAFNFAPKGWALCNGQVMSIQQNTALFSLLGTTYGGDGITTFNLPNLQGNVPMHFGNSYIEGQTGGVQSVTLLSNQAGHSHGVSATATANSSTAAGNFPATSGKPIYGGSTNTTMNAAIISPAGGNQPHSNLQPYLVVNFIIALVGIFPSRN
jgi:microcystin-dependent protein